MSSHNRFLRWLLIFLILFLFIFSLSIPIASQNDGKKNPQTKKNKNTQINITKLTVNFTAPSQHFSNSNMFLDFSEPMYHPPKKKAKEQENIKKIKEKIISKIHISPEADGKWSWIHPKRLEFSPITQYTPSTRYHVTLSAPITCITGKSTTKNLTWSFDASRPYLRFIQAKSWKKHREVAFYDSKDWLYDRLIKNEVEASDFFLLEFNQVMDLRKLKKYITVHDDSDNLTVPFKLFRTTREKVKLIFGQPLKRGKNYTITIGKGVPGVDGNLRSRFPLKMRFHTTPTFKLTTASQYSCSDKIAEINVYFSNSLSGKRVTSKQVGLFYKKEGGGETRLETKVSLRMDYKEIAELQSKSRFMRLKFEPPQGNPGYGTYVVYLDKSIENKYGETLNKNVRVEVPVWKGKLRPDLNFSPHDFPPLFDCNNIKEVDFEIFTFDGIPFEKIWAWDDEYEEKDYYANNIVKTYGALNRTDRLSRYIRSQQVQTYRLKDGNMKNLDIDLEGVTDSGTGFFGILPGRLKAAVAPDFPGFFKYNESRKPILILLHRRKVDFLLRTDGETNMVRVYEPGTMRPIDNARFEVRRDGKDLGVRGAEYCSNGFYRWRFPLKAGDLLKVVGEGRENYAWYRPKKKELNFPTVPPGSGKLFTEKGLYEPGETVHIGGVINLTSIPKPRRPIPATHNRSASPKHRKSPIAAQSGVQGPATREGIKPPPGAPRVGAPGGPPEAIKLTITDPQGATIDSATVKLNHNGGFDYAFKTAKNALKGGYYITAASEDDDIDFSCSFTVDIFEANEFDVSVQKLNPVSLPGEVKKMTVSGRYLSGNPMAGASVDYRVRSGEVGHYPAKILGARLKGFVFDCHDDFKNWAAVDIWGRGKLDKDGVFELRKGLKKLDMLEYPVLLEMAATGISAEGKEVSAVERTLCLPGERAVGIKVPGEVERGKNFSFQLAMLRAGGGLGTGTAAVTLYERSEDEVSQGKVMRQGKFYYKTIKKWPSLSISQIAVVKASLKDEGDYLLTAHVRDGRRRLVKTSASFQVKKRASIGAKETDFEIIAPKRSGSVGEVLPLQVFSTLKGSAMITMERYGIIDAFPLDVTGPVTNVQLELKKEYFPGVVLRVVMITAKGKKRSASMDLTVRDNGRRLAVDILPEKEILRPASPSRIQVKVKDGSGRGVKAGLFIYAVDEGNLALTGYESPDLLDYFYLRRQPWKNLEKRVARTFFSHGNRLMRYFYYPRMDVSVDCASYYGRVVNPDGAGIPGVRITRFDDRGKVVDRFTTTAAGYYRFAYDSGRARAIKLEAPGYVSYFMDNASFRSHHMMLNFVMHGLKKGETSRLERFFRQEFEPEDNLNFWDGFSFNWGVEGGVEGGIQGGVIGGVVGGDLDCFGEGGSVYPVGAGAGPRFRRNMKPVLFFKHIETDHNGDGEVVFETSDMITSYRIMAVAYTENRYGGGARQLTVNAPLVIKESMPQFAVVGDRFKAGALISNLSSGPLSLAVDVEPGLFRIDGRKETGVKVASRRNKPLWWTFHAPEPGMAEVKFSALSRGKSGAVSDGLIKEIPVYDDLVDDSIFVFDAGEMIRKKVEIKKGYINPECRLTVSTSPLNITGKIAKVILTYPYGCMEQRTTGILPYLALKKSLLTKIKVNKTREQMEEVIWGYIERARECLDDNGGMAYYPNSGANEYLTVYSLWALMLARERGYEADDDMIDKMIGFLEDRALSPERRCFFLYVLSFAGQADLDQLEDQFKHRDRLSPLGKIFLYKAFHRQLLALEGDKKEIKWKNKWKNIKEKTSLLLAELESDIKVVGKTAYWDGDGTSYRSSLPFYGSRFMSALLLQAVLEVEGSFKYAPHMMAGLLGVDSRVWNTTQSNFWILYALSEYLERENATYAKVRIGNRMYRADFGKKKTLKNEAKDSAEGSVTYVHDLSSFSGVLEIEVEADRNVYVNIDVDYKTRDAGAVRRGVGVKRNVYDGLGRRVENLKRGEFYQVELLVDADKELPFAVIDEPLPAGVSFIRKDHVTSRKLKEFHQLNKGTCTAPSWLREEHEHGRTIFYTKSLPRKTRIVYFIKAIYSGHFTWHPTKAEAMYEPQFFGRYSTKRIEVVE